MEKVWRPTRTTAAGFPAAEVALRSICFQGTASSLGIRSEFLVGRPRGQPCSECRVVLVSLVPSVRLNRAPPPPNFETAAAARSRACESSKLLAL